MIEQNRLVTEVQRPWIQVSVSIGKGDWSEGRIRFPYYVTIKNIGPVPGVCVSFRHRDSICEENHFKTSGTMLVEMLDSCQRETGDNGGYVIMPQEERTIYCGWAAKFMPQMILDVNGEPHIKVCIGVATAYKKSKSGEIWVTAKSYLVGIMDEADPFVSDRIPISELRQISKRKLMARLDGWTKTT